MARIGVDLDGVLYPWEEVANEVCVRRFGINPPGEHQEWNHLKMFLTKAQLDWLWSPEGMRECFGDVSRMYPGMREVVLALLRSELEVHFVTHRNPATLGQLTVRYLQWWFPDEQYEGLHITRGTDKSQLLGWDYFIEDKPSTVLALLAQGATVFVPALAHNRELLNDPRVGRQLVYYSDPADILRTLDVLPSVVR